MRTIYEAKNQNSVDSTRKRDGNVPNISEMEDTGFQDVVEIGIMLPASTLHQHANTECNNYSHYPLMNCKMSSSKNISLSTLTSPSFTSRNDEVCSFTKSNTPEDEVFIFL